MRDNLDDTARNGRRNCRAHVATLLGRKRCLLTELDELMHLGRQGHLGAGATTNPRARIGRYVDGRDLARELHVTRAAQPGTDVLVER
jgi:hypothetical protein